MITVRAPGLRSRQRLFENDMLDMLTLTPPLLFFVVWACVLGGAATFTWCQSALPAFALAGLIAGGFLLWTLFEYLSHRFIFHHRPGSPIARRIVFLLHDNHHIDPSDPYRNIMPLGISLGLAVLFFLAFQRILGAAGVPIFLGFIVGYALYDATHYACHQWPMRGKWLNRLKRHHLRHHLMGQEANYAITVVAWDRIFHTALPLRK